MGSGREKEEEEEARKEMNKEVDLVVYTCRLLCSGYRGGSLWGALVCSYFTYYIQIETRLFRVVKQRQKIGSVATSPLQLVSLLVY